MADPFDVPASGDFIDWDDLEGRLLLITVKEDVLQKTKFDKAEEGPTKAIRADIAVLDGPVEGRTNVDQGTVYEDALIFGRVLHARLRPRIGGMVLARLTCERSKELQAQYGKNAKKWNLSDEYSEPDAVLARQWIDAHKVDPFAEKTA